MTHTLYPSGCRGKKFLGYPIASDLVYYSGPTLPNSGGNTYEDLNAILQKLDAKLEAQAITEAVLGIILNNPTIKQVFCNIVQTCV